MLSHSLLLAALLCLALMPTPSSAQAGTWGLTHESERTENASGLTYVQRHFQRISDGRTGSIQLVFFSSRAFEIAVIDLGAETSRYDSTRDAFVANGCVAGCNGGFFHPDFRPLGLMIADGDRTHKMESSKLLSGVVYADAAGIHIVRRGTFVDNPGITALLQSGPFLVENGVTIRGLSASDPRKRTFIATDWNYNWAIGASSTLTLAELGELLGHNGIATGWKVDRALNLDGGSSTTLFVDLENEADIDLRPWKRVRNLVGIQPR